MWVDFEGIEQLFGILRIAEQELQFAGIEPDAATTGAIIDFNFLKLKGNHCIFANRTIHKNSPLICRTNLNGWAILHSLRLQVKENLQTAVIFLAKDDVGKIEPEERR